MILVEKAIVVLKEYLEETKLIINNSYDDDEYVQNLVKATAIKEALSDLECFKIVFDDFVED